MSLDQVVCLSLQVVALVAALIVLWRVIGVLDELHLGPRSSGRAWGFGLSYVGLGCCAFGSVLWVLFKAVDYGYVAFLVTSAGLILFDRRRERPAKAGA